MGCQGPRRHHAERSSLAAERLLLRTLHHARVGACMPEHGVHLKAGLLDRPPCHSALCSHGSESALLMTERPPGGAEETQHDLIG